MPDRERIGFNGFAEGLDPVVHRHRTALQKMAAQTNPKAFQVQLRGLALEGRGSFHGIGRYADTGTLAEVTLSTFHHTIFDAIHPLPFRATQQTGFSTSV